MSNKAEKKKDFYNIGDILKKITSQYRFRDDTDMIRVWDIWEEALGGFIADNSKPSAFKGDVLIVNVNNSALLHQLHFLKESIIVKINKALGKEMVKDVKFKAGSDDFE